VRAHPPSPWLRRINKKALPIRQKSFQYVVAVL
jgi:hypothetical protein